MQIVISFLNCPMKSLKWKLSMSTSNGGVHIDAEQTEQTELTVLCLIWTTKQ